MSIQNKKLSTKIYKSPAVSAAGLFFKSKN